MITACLHKEALCDYTLQQPDFTVLFEGVQMVRHVGRIPRWTKTEKLDWPTDVLHIGIVHFPPFL